MAPRPSLAQLDTLVNDARLSGLHVEVSLSGPVDDLPPALDVSAFRIVQEGLTNAIRHGGQCRATVGLRCGQDCLELEIITDRVLPAPAVSDTPGRGLIGMRERVQMLGGEFDAGRAGEGFRVRASLPLQPTS